MKRIKIILVMVFFLAFSSVSFAQSTTPTFNQYVVEVEKIKNVKVNLRSQQRCKNAPYPFAERGEKKV